MSDSEDSTVTYKEVSSPFEGLSDIGSPGVEGPPMMLEDPYAYVVATFQAPPLPDYVPGPKEPEQAPYLPEFVPELVYPNFVPLEDEILLAEEQPLPAVDSPTADSPGYITESDPEEDDKDPEEDPAGYPTDRDDDDDDDEEDEELLAIPSPLPSPLSPLSSRLPQIPSPPLPILPHLPLSSPSLHASPTYPLGYREAISTSHPPPPIILPHTRASVAMLRVAAPSTYILASRSETPPSGTPPFLPIPLPTSSPPPLLLPSMSRREDVPKVTLPPRKRLCIALGSRFEVGESSSASTARPMGFEVGEVVHCSLFCFHFG
nr:hypothetical protein [Tanacetum cinerariifolium]